MTQGLPEALQKRVRLAKILSIFAAIIMAGSVPFDAAEGPRAFLIEDAVAVAVYLMIGLCIWRRNVRGARLFLIVFSNGLVLVNCAIVGRETGAAMVFMALIAVPFTFYDLSERGPLIAGVVLAVVCFFVANLDALVRFRQVPPYFSNIAYTHYVGVMTIGVLLFSLGQTSRANARAERALRADIAKREAAERELAISRHSAILSAKMAALGEMSGNIAHEINNPLAAIFLQAENLGRLARKDRLDTKAVAKAGRNIESTVIRIRRVVDALRGFARDAERDPMRPESVREVVNDTIELCSKRFQQRAIALDVAPIPEDLRVVCRAVQISQVLLNLLGNAYDAVETQRRRHVGIIVDADDAHVWIAVTDSGPGIPPELRTRIMEPYFTTKPAGEGTGLGLSVSRGIAHLHGGDLLLDPSSPETRFVLILPRARPSSGGAGLSAPAGA